MSLAPRILLIAANPDDRALVIRELSRGFTEFLVEPVADERALEAALQSGDIDLVITGDDVGWSTGLWVLQSVKECRPDCPVIMLGEGENRTAIDVALKAGLDDYVVHSPEHMPRLLGAVRQALSRAAQVQTALEAETPYRKLFEHIPVGLFRSTVHGHILDVNRALVAMLGYPDRESLLLVNAFQLYWSPEDRERWQAASETKSVLEHTDLRLRRYDGGSLWVRGGARLVRDGDGQPLYYEGSAVDITDQKRAEEALERRSGEMEALFRALPDLLFHLDYRDVVVDYQAGKAADLLAPSGAPIGKCLDQIFPPTASAQLDKAARRARESRTVATLEFVLDQARGDETYEARFVPLAAEHLLVLVRNITEKRRLETRLYLSQKLEAIGRLAGGIAHDFNNIVNVIMGLGALVAKRLPEGSSLVRYANDIQTAAARAADLTRQLLAFSRQQVLQPRVLDLNELVSNFEKMLRRVIGEDVELVTCYGRALGHIHADAGQVEQVILNLVINARDAMPAGGRLAIETRNVELEARDADTHVPVIPGPYVLLTVADSGRGMDAETRERIFEPFFTTKSQGTGLGLATAYGIVKQSGGYIFVDSEPDRGSTFRIYFPQVAATLRAPVAIKEPAIDSGGSETILVVEDEGSLREVIREMLEEKGYRVVLAGSGGEALEASAAEHPIHLLLTDIVMPGMNGRQVAERLTAQLAGLKVLYMSGYTFDTLREGLETQGIFLQKPFTAEVLTRKVRAILDGEARVG